MAAESPGWCRSCFTPIEQPDRPSGRAREFCNDRCRQTHHRRTTLRAALRQEVGLTEKQTDRLLDLFTVTAKTSKRDASVSRSGSPEGRG